MKQLITLAAVAAATITMLASCNKDGVNGGGENPLGDQPKTISLSMIYPDGGTRAVADPVTADDYIDFEKGHIFFVTLGDTNAEILLHVGIDNGMGSQQVTLADLVSKEAIITGVPAEANLAYLIGNDDVAKFYSNSGINVNLEGTKLTDLLSNNGLVVINMNDANGTVDNVPVYSEGLVNLVAGTTPVGNLPFDATVTLPLTAPVTRIEVAQISAKPYTDPEDVTYTISDFTVEGIYINNYYPTFDVMGYPRTTDLVYNNGTNPANYATTGTTQYAGGNAVGLADFINQPATGGSLAPAGGKVWAYNVFGSPMVTPYTIKVPHIVIKISSFTYTTSADPTPVVVDTPKFITVTGFLLGDGTKLDPLWNGSVYSFSNLTFDYSNLANTPEAGAEYNVQAIVVVLPWNVISVNPEY